MDFYEVLGVSREEASDLDLLKKSYRNALLSSHPDKQALNGGDGDMEVELVRKAYEVLSDAQKRKDYDRMLKNVGKSGPVSVSEVVDLDDLVEHEGETFYWTRSCRCGEEEGYRVTEDDLVANGSAEEINIQCVGCSIWIKVQYTTAEE